MDPGSAAVIFVTGQCSNVHRVNLAQLSRVVRTIRHSRRL
jgi:hypothetical protein